MEAAENEKEAQIKALNKLADYLARRDHSEVELRSKLSQKNFSQQVIDWALEQAHERKWMADPYDLAVRVSETLHRKGRGILYINRYLQEKGLPTVDKDCDRELSKARDVVRRKLNQEGNLSFADKQKAYKYLNNRGFDDETAKKVMYGQSGDSQ